MSANAKETTDFKHREHDVFVVHDEVIDRPDGLVFVVGDGMADQLARSIAFGDKRQIDLDELNPLGKGDFRVLEA
jgi:hypothetical protein